MADLDIICQHGGCYMFKSEPERSACEQNCKLTWQVCQKCQQQKPLKSFITKGGKTKRNCQPCRSKSTGKRARVLPGDTHKKCPGCNRIRDLRFFYDRTGGRVRSRCYDCELEQKKAGRAREAEVKQETRRTAAAKVKETGMKTCSECNEELPIERFPKNKNSLDGHGRRCTVCSSIKRKGISSEDSGRYRRWKERDAMFKEISESAPRKNAKKGIYNWSDDD
jgi:hypothetical protein